MRHTKLEAARPHCWAWVRIHRRVVLGLEVQLGKGRFGGKVRDGDKVAGVQ